MWLLDANMDVHLVSVLNEFNSSCDTAGKRGWKSLSNGDLVKAAVDAGFSCLLTRDQLFGQFRIPRLKALSTFLCCGGERPTTPVDAISRTIHRALGRLSHQPRCGRADPMAINGQAARPGGAICLLMSC